MSNQKPPREPGQTCPLWRRDVSRVCHKCEWYDKIQGQNPQTGEHLDEWACVMRRLPFLQLENARQSSQAGASADKVATEVAKVGKAVSEAASVVSRSVREFHQHMADQNAALLDGQINGQRLIGNDGRSSD